MSTEPLSIIAWALGVIGFSGIAATLRLSRRLSRQYRLFRLDRSASCIDIVLPTSDRANGGVGIRYMRSTTAVGNLRGATEIAAVVGHVLRRRLVSVAVSEDIESKLGGDLVLIGLPAKNRASRIVLNYLQCMHPDIGFTLTEDGGCSISLGTFKSDYEVVYQAGTQIPTRDFALVLLWINPNTARKHRLILCAGFTAYGTAAAARYLVTDIIDNRYRHLRRDFKGQLPRLYTSRSWPCFVAVLETTLVNDQVVNIQERAFVPLPDPGAPPWHRAHQIAPVDMQQTIAGPAGLPAALPRDAQHHLNHSPQPVGTGSSTQDQLD